MKNYRRLSIYILLLLVIFTFVKGGLDLNIQERDKLTTSEFISKLEQGQVKSIEKDEQIIRGELVGGQKFTTTIDDPTYNSILPLLTGVEFEIIPPQRPNFFVSILTYILPFVLLLVIFFFFMQQSQGGGSRVMNFGKSRAKLHDPNQKRVTFKDVAGVDEAKEELEEIVDFLKNPKKFIELGARIPKGVLLFGPPGTGKTLLARAVAGEAGVPFFSISGSDFVEMFVGVGASRVRDLFENAKKNAPCIIFIDEIDAVGRQRGAGLGGGHDEREQTLNQLLVEMDGFGTNEGIIVMAATNRPDILDNALLRPGRFDRQITVDSPDVKGREEILRIHSRNKPLSKDVNLEILAKRTPGFTGADLENLINEAALLAARKNMKIISMEDLENAIDRVIAGPEKKKKVRSEAENKLVAYHEAGHAIVGHFLEHADPIHKVTIVPRGRAGGYTLALPKEDRYFMSKSEILDKLSMLLAGRVAEQIALNEISTGAQNDLERVTQLAHKMIMEFGMSEKLGPLTFGQKQDHVFLGRDIARERNYSEEVASAIDKETKAIVERCYKVAEDILKKHRDKLDLVAKTLLEKETINREEFLKLMGETEPEKEETKHNETEIVEE
ncbi:cell division protease FtsH [Anaerobranca californiensis DSM 14826]|jgi:cell division protease FtsH|uniref:ATP-dependent zinc metalloprotease FtsH n=1 Tax=Anaerobranca californiensis DSM 14826 TaxID=1120989 RepID=A0A1M6PH75_9FIRM|nr:ATP-dependent zinc metalloprotease FtsH [Anaerobranca californiensis]SHK07283.1 cell division protease FtsH [Anaerobranca californiensis DSM 14826]